jgi:hypothetical protein
MTYARRPLVIDSLARWVDRNGEVMRGIDPILRQELGAFVVRDDGRVMADAGMYDDMVMATAIWLYVLEERGLEATPGVIVEPEAATFNVNHIFAEAEQARRLDLRDRRREMRRMARSGRL